MSMDALQAKLTQLRQALSEYETDVANKLEMLAYERSKEPGLCITLERMENELRRVIHPDDIPAAREAVNEATLELEACQTLISNLEQYTRGDESYKFRDQIKDVTNEILHLKYDEILEVLSLSDDELTLLKDFVVVSHAIRDSRDWWGFNLGAAFTQLYGELREGDLVAHRETLYESLDIEV
ncbi:hypothetical protein [Thaumasiovibrio sp. DFM-14]|uniref:hypothetical protein n=1 Tax=Thaumasiovibrio sp. DFM-14 TaxID=3384792 RepID=UPI0039A11D52